MEIEIVEFYPETTKPDKRLMKGTLHVYLVDCDLDLRGVIVSKRNDKWHFGLPTRKAFDSDANKMVHYPVVTFANAHKAKELMAEIRKKGIEYIEKKLGNLALTA